MDVFTKVNQTEFPEMRKMMKNLFVFQESKYDVKRLCKLANYGGGEMTFCKRSFSSYHVCLPLICNITGYATYCCLLAFYFQIHTLFNTLISPNIIGMINENCRIMLKIILKGKPKYKWRIMCWINWQKFFLCIRQSYFEIYGKAILSGV